MRQGTTIDPETAQRILKKLARHMMDGENTILKTRPVIWSYKTAHQALMDTPNPIPMPQRKLAHLVCADGFIKVLLQLPDCESDGYLGVMVLEFKASYSGEITASLDPKIYAVTDEDAEELKQAFKEAKMKHSELKIRRHDIFSIPDLVERRDDSLRPLWTGAALEYYAFSTYAITRPRPTTKQATNPNPKKKGFAALEVVSLRLPEKRPDATPGTGKKLDMRIQVSQHLRRQPTKNGIKLITIAEHWRGPESAPVKPKAAKIYKVVK